jgi:hypothetical protein
MVITEPWVRDLSDKVKVLFGYRDGHAKLEVQAPAGITVPVTLTAVEIEKIKKAFDQAHAWAMKSGDDRKTGKGDQEQILDPRGKVTFGFPDGHVVIAVRVVKMSPWIPLEISRDELLQGKKVMDEVSQWANLPQEVRQMQSTL